ncbi:uncharacterized protein JCM6883_000229 [Sporobolomyces salmoneus]|uniref:uncharacterized protein n=1 Tax=Sporobolomyces salmoneus TaxID=183962 RepID=UPI003180748B
MSVASQQLNEASQPVGVQSSSPSSKPLLSPASPNLTTFTHTGISYRSIGVLCTPELVQQANKEREEKIIKVDRFKALPDHVLKAVLEWTVRIEMEKSEKAVREADRTDCALRTQVKAAEPTVAVLAFVRTYRVARSTERHDVFGRLSRISRRTYHLLRPKYWRELDMSCFTVHSYGTGGINTVNRLLYSKTTISLPVSPTKTSLDTNTSAQTKTDQTAPEASSSSSPPPKKKRKRVLAAAVVPRSNEVLPTFGEIVNTILIGTYSSSVTYFFNNYLLNLPNLQHVVFPKNTAITLRQFEKFAQSATYSLRTVKDLYLPSNEDRESQIESILTLFNAAPNLESFGVSGNFILDELRGKRLGLIWRLNSRLKHSPTGCLGVGLKELYFGQGCEMTVGFLRSLKENCPRLNKLHITQGVKITLDSTPLGGTPFDLASFAVQWSLLTSFTLIGTDTFNASGTLDAILKVNSTITHLHVRSDHISYSFFSSIVNDFAKLPSTQLLPPRVGVTPTNLATSQIGSETPTSNALVEASKNLKYGDKSGLNHSLKHLAITYRLAEGDQKPSGLHIPSSKIVPFSLLLLSFQARGLEWPNEMGGQRDLLNRAALMVNLESKKQRELVKREKEEREKKRKEMEAQAEKEKEKENGGGEGKGKGKEKEVEKVVVEEEEVPILDIEITSAADA